MSVAVRSLWAPPPEMPARQPAGATLAAATGVSVSLGGHRVLDGVDMAVRAGEVVALVGPNGAGKSTLLAALTGDRAVDGPVEVEGRPLGEWDEGDLARRRAVLPQRTAVGFPFTVEEVVRMGRAPWARTDAEDADDDVVAAALADADVTHLAGRTVPSLSGGEAARTAFARVLAQATQLLLLDEPTAALDLQHQERTMDVVRRRVDAGDGAVVVLHDLDLAGAHADRVVLMDHGRVVAAGPPVAVLEAERLSAVYGHPVEVIAHPRTGLPLVLPRRVVARRHQTVVPPAP